MDDKGFGDVSVPNVTVTGSVNVGGHNVMETLLDIQSKVGGKPGIVATRWGPMVLANDTAPFWLWVQSLNFVTQSAHFGWGGMVTMMLALWLHPLLAAGIVFGVCAFKELAVDNYTWGEGHGTPDWLDLLFYSLGIGAALVALIVAGQL